MRRFSQTFVPFVLVLLLAGCASTTTPAQMALAYRQIFNGAIQTIHELHAEGKLSAEHERALLPVILAGSAALDQMDADAASGDQASFNVATAAAQAALAQLQGAAQPTTAPSTDPAITKDALARPTTRPASSLKTTGG